LQQRTASKINAQIEPTTPDHGAESGQNHQQR
jgi:hypothetical protein